MSEKYKFRDPEGMYFVTMATVGWVDLFTRKELKHVMIGFIASLPKGKRVSYSCMVSYAQPPPHDSINKKRSAARHYAGFQKVYFQRIGQDDQSNK